MVLCVGVMDEGGVDPPPAARPPAPEAPLAPVVARVPREDVERAGVRLAARWLLAATERRLAGLTLALLLASAAGCRPLAAVLAEALVVEVAGPVGWAVATLGEG